MAISSLATVQETAPGEARDGAEGAKPDTNGKNTVPLPCPFTLVVRPSSPGRLRPDGHGIKMVLAGMSTWYAAALTEGRANS